MDEPMLHDLLRRGRQGDMEAVEEVVTWLQQEKRAFVRRRLWEASVPERDLSHALVEVWNEVRLHLPEFRGERQGAVILFVKRICQTIARRYRQGPEVPTSPWDLETLPTPSVRPNPERTVDLQEAFGKALDQLSCRDAEIYILSVKGHTLDEIARLKHCSVRKARRRREKAQRDIREWMTLLHIIIVEWHLTPPHPTVGQQVEVWLTLWNTGYEDVEGLKVKLRVDKRRLGQHVLVIFPQDAQQDVRGFTPWRSQPHPQQLVVTVALGGKTQEITRQVLTEHTL